MTDCNLPLCMYRAAQLDRALTELLALRLEVADGPRARVRELEQTVASLNRTIAARNAELEKQGRRAS